MFIKSISIFYTRRKTCDEVHWIYHYMKRKCFSFFFVFFSFNIFFDFSFYEWKIRKERNLLCLIYTLLRIGYFCLFWILPPPQIFIYEWMNKWIMNKTFLKFYHQLGTGENHEENFMKNKTKKKWIMTVFRQY